MTKTEIIKDAIRRFEHLPVRTIARYVLHNYGPVFDGSLEKIRSAIRYHIGQNGEKNRELLKEKVSHSSQGIPQTWRVNREAYNLSPGLWFVINDAHVPFHELKPIEAAFKYAQAEKVDGLLFNGDMQDCASVSFWPSGRKRDFDKEVELFIDFLDFTDSEFPKAKKVYKPGNHEYRLPRYYQSKAPELIGLPLQAVDGVLGLEYRGIEFLDYFQIVMAGKLPILHGHEIPAISRAVNPARGLFLRAKSWAMCGHCHTTSEHTSKNIQGTLLTTWSVGCLCDLSPDYNPFGNDWNWGFALINVEKNGDFEVVNRRILPNGKVV
jgi:predicted phosphodiesterase